MTVGLLLIGLLDATRTVALARDMPALLDEVFGRAGFGDYTADDVAGVVGGVVIALNLVAVVVAISLAVPRLRLRRRAFPVPLVTGGVCAVLTVLLMLVAVAADPAVAGRLGG